MKFTRGERISFLWTTLLLSTLFWPCLLAEIVCPPYQDIPYCSCFVLDDQLHIQCSGSDFATLKKSLQVLNGPVKSFSVYDLDARASVLPNGLTDNVTSPVFHLQVSPLLINSPVINTLSKISISYSPDIAFICRRPRRKQSPWPSQKSRELSRCLLPTQIHPPINSCYIETLKDVGL